VKTPDGWRFASRTVVTKAESDAGLTAEDLVAIQRLSGDELGDHYVANDAGGRRLLTSGVAISVASGKITGRAYLRDGGHYEDVYEKTPSGEWRIASRVKVPAQGEAR
jgi:hypothetical protein